MMSHMNGQRSTLSAPVTAGGAAAVMVALGVCLLAAAFGWIDSVPVGIGVGAFVVLTLVGLARAYRRMRGGDSAGLVTAIDFGLPLIVGALAIAAILSLG